MRLCFVWQLHQLPGWHPRLANYTLPWARIQTLRAHAPLLDIALQDGAAPFCIAISPDLLQFLNRILLEGRCDAMLDLHQKTAERLSPAEIESLVSFAFEAGTAQLAAPYPRYAALFARWESMRGNRHRLQKSLSMQDLQDLQVLTQLAWLSPTLQTQSGDIFLAATAGEAQTHEQALALASLQIQALRDYLETLRGACRTHRVEYLGGALHQALLPMLTDEVPGFCYPDDARTQIVRGPRVHCRIFGERPPVLHLAEGALSSGTLEAMQSVGLEWSVSGSHVLRKCLGRTPTAAESVACWSHGTQRILFSQTELFGLFRFVYPLMNAERAYLDFQGRLETIRREAADADGALIVQIHPKIDPSSSVREMLSLWRKLLHQAQHETGFEPSRIETIFQEAKPQPLPELVSWTGRPRGFARWAPESQPLFWKLLRDARSQFQKVRAWKILEPSQLNAARDALLALESKDWVDCLGREQDPWTQRHTEELLRAHFETVYRSLDLERPTELKTLSFSDGTRITSIGPSRSIRPQLDGKRSSYTSWSGSGYFRERPDVGSLSDTWRQISELYYGSDGAYVYLRTALPMPAREMLNEFALQGVLHAMDSTQAVSWFQIEHRNGETQLTTRLAVPPSARKEEQPQAVVDDVVDLRIPLSALGLRLGEVLRFQVSLWEQGNAVAAAPPLGWEEFVVEDSALSTEWESSTLPEALQRDGALL